MTEPRKKPAKSKRPRRAAADQSVAPSAKPIAAGNWPARLRAIRAKLGDCTQKEAADRIGASARAWFYWEAGHFAPGRPYQRLLEQLENSLK